MTWTLELPPQSGFNVPKSGELTTVDVTDFSSPTRWGRRRVAQLCIGQGRVELGECGALKLSGRTFLDASGALRTRADNGVLHRIVASVT